MDVHPKYPFWLPVQFRTGYLLSRKINRTFSSVVDDSTAEKLFAVEGHITARQCATLFYFAYDQSCSGCVVEIGSFKGKSTVWMAQALKQRAKQERVTAIDPHINTGDDEVVPRYTEESSYDAFVRNVSGNGLDNWVQTVKATSETAAKDWNQQIRTLFIDGSHRYEDVILDLRLWEPWVNVGGVIILHDTKPSGAFEGVRRAMKEHLGDNAKFSQVLQLLNMTVFRKLSN